MDHDAAHKYLYMLDDVVADLLRLVVPRWVDELDLAAIEDVSAEYLDEDHRRRLGDMVWKVYFREGALANGRRPYVLVLVEFQSTADRDMARRIHEYTDLLLDRLVRNGVVEREGGLPRVLPVVVYNGSERWTAIGGDGRDGGEGYLAPVPSARAERDLAPLQPQRYRLVDENAGSEQDWPTHNRVAATVRLQRSAPRDLRRRLLTEARRFPGAEHEAFRQALHAWARALWVHRMGAEDAFPSFDELEKEQGMTTIFEARWDQEVAHARAEGAAQGRERGLEQGRELGLELGLEQGRELGLEQGRADERARLRRQAALKFGLDTHMAERLSSRLAGLTNREDLDRVGDWIVECDSVDELLSRLRSIGPST